MKFIEGYDRTQTLLFPQSLDAYIDADNEVRLIDLFVDSLGKLPQKLKRLKLEFVNVEAYEKIKVYGVTNRGHFEAAGSWSKYQ